MENGRGIKRNEEVVYRDLAAGEGAVLLHVGSGAYHGLNVTGSLIWSLIDGERTREDIVLELQSRLDDPRDAVGDDVNEFLDDLSRRNLIHE
jgi:Coenzyme PQQ synthesis protein D (PqqD)